MVTLTRKPERVILAIKAHRAIFNSSLKESKDAICETEQGVPLHTNPLDKETMEQLVSEIRQADGEVSIAPA